MGSQESKIEEPQKQERELIPVLNDSAPSTPILTPLDPRSPTANIARTPLELILGPDTKETKEDEAEEETEERKEVVNVVLGIDPRSPTVEFNRTPIIVETVTKEKPRKLLNKNFDNVRKSVIQTTPVGTGRKNTNIVPPRLLEVSPATIVSNYNNKRKSFVGLLETNIDFTETDLDSICQAKDKVNMSLPLDVNEDLLCNKLKDQMEALQDDVSSSKLTPESSSDQELVNDTKDEKTKKILEEKVINVTAQVKDFDKKLTNLIYQDDSDDDKMNLKFAKFKENNRTPLSIRNSNEDTKKSQSRLKVSDKPRKSENSKIPILKDSRKIGVQCENTPPSKLEKEKYKTKVSHWDADKTLII